MASKGKKVLSYHDVLLREFDVALLDGPQWINDNLIAFWMHYLEKAVYKKHRDQVEFVTPDVVQFIKLGTPRDVLEQLKSLELERRTLIVLPVNDCTEFELPGGCHWSLLVYDARKKIFEHYDSCNGSNTAHARRVAEALKSLLGLDRVHVTEACCAQQHNSYDCGLHVLHNLQQACARHLGHRGEFVGDFGGLTDEMEHNRAALRRLILCLSEEN
ncbi:unnamed protein product [Ixodes hexagonus]